MEMCCLEVNQQTTGHNLYLSINQTKQILLWLFDKMHFSEPTICEISTTEKQAHVYQHALVQVGHYNYAI